MRRTAGGARQLARVERRRLRRFFAGIVLAIGVLDVFGALVYGHPLRDQTLQALLPAQVSLGGRTGVVLVGLALILLARGIARGKRAAWFVTCLLLLISMAFHLLSDLDIEEAIMAGWLCLGLWWMRHHFEAGSDPTAIRKGAMAMVGALGLAVLYAFPASWLLQHQLTPSVTAGRTLGHLTHTAVHGTSPYQALTDRAQWFLDSLPLVTWALILYGVIRLLHPVVLPNGGGAAERERVRLLLRRLGHNPVSHLSLLGDKRYFWVGSQGCLAYRLEGRVALVLGDPIAPAARRQSVIDAFLEFCDRQDWTPAFYQTESDEPYGHLGFGLIPVGLDAVVRLDHLDLAMPERAELRYVLRRCQRSGVSFSFLSSTAAWAILADELRMVSDQWLRGKGQEMAFSLGTLDMIREDPDLTISLARDADGRLIAFASWLPVPGRRGWTLDLMRRRRDSPPGVMDGLLTASLLEARRRGLVEVSLGLAPLALPQRPSGISTVFRLMYPRLDRFYGSRTLRRFKAKFLPSWEQRYLAVPAPSLIPEVLAALVMAHYPRFRPHWPTWLPAARRAQAGSRKDAQDLLPAAGRPSIAS